jgi:hypothetical protein
MDAYQNTSINDPAVPYYGVLKLDSTKAPGSYNWHQSVVSVSPTQVYDHAWHVVSVTSISGTLHISIDGAGSIGVVGVTSSYNGLFGFTAATGGASGVGIFIDEVAIRLPNSACPTNFP